MGIENRSEAVENNARPTERLLNSPYAAELHELMDTFRARAEKAGEAPDTAEEAEAVLAEYRAGNPAQGIPANDVFDIAQWSGKNLAGFLDSTDQQVTDLNLGSVESTTASLA